MKAFRPLDRHEAHRVQLVGMHFHLAPLIARAVYRQPSLLLLDEATSQLDIAAETAVSGAIRALRVTRIIVAHRPETSRSCDRVIHVHPPTRFPGRHGLDPSAREGHAIEVVSGGVLPSGY